MSNLIFRLKKKTKVSESIQLVLYLQITTIRKLIFQPSYTFNYFAPSIETYTIITFFGWLWWKYKLIHCRQSTNKGPLQQYIITTITNKQYPCKHIYIIYNIYVWPEKLVSTLSKFVCTPVLFIRVRSTEYKYIPIYLASTVNQGCIPD